MDKKKVLVIGSGGREYALAWKLAQSPRVERLWVVPGNGGTAQIAENVLIAATDIEKLVRFARETGIDLTVVGPDDPLALGIVDRFQDAGLKIFGPQKAAAQIEVSKVFAKEFMKTHAIPTAAFRTFRDHDDALRYVRQVGAPIVIKADGLALGKGVSVCRTLEEAESALERMMVERVFGDAGSEVVIEEFLEGEEVSIHAFSDGSSFKLLLTSQDHKPIFDGDKGPNTGGMGTIVPVPWVTPSTLEEISRLVVAPALEGMRQEGKPFQGLLYPGLKMTSQGPKVLEFNARFGDPETQSYIRLLKADLFDILEACSPRLRRVGAGANGTLDKVNIEWNQGFAACIVVASGGYPGKYQTGKPIEGIAEAEKLPGVVVFHAGTALKDGAFVTSGGRVLGVTATGRTLKEALDRAYAGVAKIHFDGMQYRKDIGAKTLGGFASMVR